MEATMTIYLSMLLDKELNLTTENGSEISLALDMEGMLLPLLGSTTDSTLSTSSPFFIVKKKTMKVLMLPLLLCLLGGRPLKPLLMP